MSQKMICILILLSLLLSIATVMAPTPAPGPSGGGGGGGSSLNLNSFTNKLKSWQKENPTQYQNMTELLGNSGGVKPNPVEKPSFLDAQVTPKSGKWTDEFVYEARLQSKNDSEATLGLDVFIPSTKSWKSLDDKEVRSYMYNKGHIASARWKFKEFTPDDAGNASNFKVYYYDQFNTKVPLSKELVGPTNITKSKIYVLGQVAPRNGSCNQYYNYSFKVYHAEKARMKIGLEVFLPGVGDWYPLGEKAVYPSRYDDKNNATVYWYLKPFTLDDTNKTSRFRVSYEDEKQNFGTVEWDGPELVNHPPSIKEHKVEPGNGTSMESFTYSALVQDEDGDDVALDLILYDPEKNSVLEKVRQTVRGIDAKNGTEVIWPYRFSETYSNKSIIYNITSDDGVGVPVFIGNNTGPMLLSEPKIAVNVVGPVSSQNNNWWDTYTVKAMVKNPSTDEATLGIKFYTAEGIIDLKEPKTVKQTSVAQECKWDFGGFTVKDRNSPIKYELTYNLADQDGRYRRIIEEEKPISDIIISWPNVAINAIWAILLGGFVFGYGSRLDGMIRKIKRIMRLSPAEKAEMPKGKVGGGEN